MYWIPRSIVSVDTGKFRLDLRVRFQRVSGYWAQIFLQQIKALLLIPRSRGSVLRM